MPAKKTAKKKATKKTTKPKTVTVAVSPPPAPAQPPQPDPNCVRFKYGLGDRVIVTRFGVPAIVSRRAEDILGNSYYLEPADGMNWGVSNWERERDISTP